MISIGSTGRVEQILIISLGIIYIIHTLTQYVWLTWVLGGLVFVIIALLLPQLRGSVLYLTVLFLILGGGLLLYQQASLLTWIQSASINTAIVTLFVFAPLFGIPVRLPKYVEAIKHLYRTKVKGIFSFFVGSQMLTSILSVFLNVGSITVAYHLASIHPFSKSKRLLGNALNRGFAGAIFCSPYFAAMAIVCSALNLAWAQILPYMLGMVLISFIVSFLMEITYMRKYAKEYVEEVELEREEIALEEQSKVLYSLIIYLVSAVLIILVLEKSLTLPMVVLTCLSAALFPLIWSMIFRAMPTYKQGIKEHARRTIPSLKKEITFFLAAGFFSGAIGEAKFGDFIVANMDRIPLPLPIAFSICTLLIIALTSLIGLHPVILVTILATGIDPFRVGITPEFLGVLLLGSWAITNTISPASAVNNLIAGLSHTDVLKVSARNYKFALILLIILPSFLFITRV